MSSVVFSSVAKLLGSGVDLLAVNYFLADEVLLVELGDRAVVLDRRRHQRLGVGRLVGFVVAETAVADHVDHDVTVPLLAVGDGQAHRVDAGLGVVSVDVDDRHVEALGHVGRVRSRAAFHRVSGEADLVVLDDVDRAADRVAVEALHVEGLGDHSLAGESGIAVEYKRDCPLRILLDLRAVDLALGEAGGTGDHRIDELEMARIGVEVDGDRLAFVILELPSWP